MVRLHSHIILLMPQIHHCQTKFTTDDNNQVRDEYFLTSGDKIRYFFEEDSIDQRGNLTREKRYAVNKIGHGLFFFSITPVCLHARLNILHSPS